ncbi:hypothetical protein C5S53_03795 [Methanophagales archaeon]|nr:hypothetical protein C5S53_03795 [Methanophagales archaeon]
MEGAEKEEIMGQCAEMLEEHMSDLTVPRNIKRLVNKVKNELRNGNGSQALRATAVISDLEELAVNPNILSHTRTLVWNLVSQLETVSVEE